MTIEIFFVGEDDLTRALCKRLLQWIFPNGTHTDISSKQGGAAGHKKKFFEVKNWNAPGHVFFVVDQDDYNCPPSLLEDWLRSAKLKKIPDRMKFCVVTRHCESWLLGDRQGLANFLNISVADVFDEPEKLDDQKAHLLKVSLKSKKFRDEVCPSAGSMARVGPNYNDVFSKFVMSAWRPEVAAQNCPTLRRAINRLKSLE